MALCKSWGARDGLEPASSSQLAHCMCGWDEPQGQGGSGHPHPQAELATLEGNLLAEGDFCNNSHFSAGLGASSFCFLRLWGHPAVPRGASGPFSCSLHAGKAALGMKMSCEQHIGPESMFARFLCSSTIGAAQRAGHAKQTRKACRRKAQ